ncbi:MAG TPA: hypothetical protein VFQ85_12860 [Mycobacteriales bacterium]|jgi:DNA-directed RNA polymerase specialized sigma24 family protein|nr:hypothetical protein [Mycobacteriales bacterium]
MAATFVMSLHRNARLAHYGDLCATACGQVFPDPFRAVVLEELPADRVVCARCAGSPVTAQERAEAVNEGVRLHGRVAAMWRQQDAELVEVMLRGGSVEEIARHFRISVRSASRRIAAAKDRAGVVTRFQWGYEVGWQHGATDTARQQ